MVKFAKIMIPSLYKPVILFWDMITNRRENFRDNVKSEDLRELVNEILLRAKDGEIGFEHL